jgi:hypothetical protein
MVEYLLLESLRLIWVHIDHSFYSGIVVVVVPGRVKEI